MASQDQCYQAGETKGQAQEKIGQGVDAMKDKAQGAKDKASEVAHSAEDRTHDTKEQTGGYLGAVKEKASETVQAAKDKAAGAAQVTKDKASQVTESGKETAQAGKDKTGGFLQKTGEQVKGMAQGATDAVKNTFGMGGEACEASACRRNIVLSKMPKDRRVNSPSFDRAMVSPYSCSLKITDRNNSESSLPPVGDETEWDEVRCPICMEHPHNAVLLLCSSQEKGCRPFMCDTSYRHSNCLDQFRKSSTAASSPTATREQQSELVCPLCRGHITGWVVKESARRFMNFKTRCCSLETCKFSGNYTELRKHARLEHPSDRPSEASPTRQSNWTMMEQQRDIEDALAHQSDFENDWDGWLSWVEDDFWNDGSFFDFPIGMSDVDNELIVDMYRAGGLSLSYFSLYSSSLEVELIDSDFPSSDRLQSSLTSTNLSPGPNSQGGNTLPSSRSTSNYHPENDPTISGSRSSYHRENTTTNIRSRSSIGRENGSTISRSRSSSYRSGNAPESSRTTSGHHMRDTLPSSRARLRYYHTGIAPPPPGRRTATRDFPVSSRQWRTT